MAGVVWVGGRIRPADEPHITVFDRGFQLGDGIFETMRARAGHVTELDEHLARLHRSADGLGIPLGGEADEEIASGIRELLRAARLDGPAGDASVRITVTRGPVHGRGLLPADEEVAPTIAIQAWAVVAPPPGHLERGIGLVSSSVRRDPTNPLAALKTTSRADYVYARLEARRSGADDALFLTVDGHLSEATSSNVFLVRGTLDGTTELATPSLACAILPGTTRSWLLRWAGTVGLRPLEAVLTPDDLLGADEAFACASVMGVIAVTSFDGSPIGDGRPGPWTRRAREDREQFIREG